MRGTTGTRTRAARADERHGVVVVGAGAAAAFALDHDLAEEDLGQAVAAHRASGAAVPA